jgi:hypothetical protein
VSDRGTRLAAFAHNRFRDDAFGKLETMMFHIATHRETDAPGGGVPPRTWRDRLVEGGAILACAAYAILLCSFPPQVKVIDADTPSYLDFSPWRSAGYPLILDGVERVFGLPLAVIPIQIWTFAAAAAFLLVVTWRLFRSPLATAVAAIALLANPFVAMFHFKLMTDSWYVSTLTAMVGLGLIALARGTRWPLIVIGGLIGFSISLRPIAAPLVLLPVLLAWLAAPRAPGRILRNVAFAALPLAAFVAAEFAVYAAAHGPERGSPAPRHLFAKAMMLPAPPALPGPLGAEARRLHETFAPARALSDGIDGFGLRRFVATRYELTAQWRFHDALDTTALERDTGLSKDEIMTMIGRAGMLAQPVAAARLALAHYASFWLVPENMSPSEYAALITLRARPEGVPLAGLVDLEPNRKPIRLWWLGRLTTLGAFLATLAALLAAGFVWLRRGLGALDPALALAAILSLSAHATAAIVAVTAVAVSRYTLTFWPFCGLVFALMLASPAVRAMAAGLFAPGQPEPHPDSHPAQRAGAQGLARLGRQASS